MPKHFLHNNMNRPYAQARRVKDIGLVLHKYYEIGEITAPSRRMRGEIFTVRVGIGVHSLSATCLNLCIIPELVYYFSPRTIRAYAGRSLRSDTTYQRVVPHFEAVY